MAINIDNLLDNVNTLCDADKLNISNTVFTSYLEDESFPAHHNVMTEIRANTPIPIIDAKPDYGFMKVSKGNCESNACDVGTTSSKKLWNPKDYDCRLVICKQNLACDFREFWGLNCHDYKNMKDAYMVFLVDQVNKSFNASQWRIGYFDTSTNTNPDYAGIDGLFQQWIALAPPTAANRYVIPENSAATVADQMNLAPDRAIEILRKFWAYISIVNPQLFSKNNLHIDMTPALAFNYLNWLQTNKEENCCFSATDGVTASRYAFSNLNYMGIPIVVRNEWAGIIEWQQSIAGTANLPNPHRAVLTYKANKPMGTCDGDAFREFDMWYEKKDKKIYIDVATSFDAKVIFDKDFALAI
jgi:hypothetical protein